MTNTIKTLQQQVRKVVNKFGFQWSDYVQYIHLVEEVGELGEALTVHLGDRQAGSGSEALADHADVKEELGDVFFNLLEIANRLDISMDEVYQETLQRYEKKLANTQK